MSDWTIDELDESIMKLWFAFQVITATVAGYVIGTDPISPGRWSFGLIVLVLPHVWRFWRFQDRLEGINNGRRD